MTSLLRPLLDAYALTLNKWTHEDRANTVGASDVGQCERKVYYTKNLGDPELGAPVDDDYVDGYGAKLRGTIFEQYFWAPALEAAFGPRLLFAGNDQQTFVSGYLSATPDGLLTRLTKEELEQIKIDASDQVMVECKTADPRSNLTEAKPENVFQTHVQMGLVRETTTFRPTHSILSYTNASFWNEGPEFVIPFDPVIYDNAKIRAAKIMTATSASELKPEGWITGGKECEYCPFVKPCGVERRSVPDVVTAADLDPQVLAEITDLARIVKQYDNAVDADTILLREAQQTLKDRMRDLRVRKIKGVVSWTPVKGRAGYDNAAIRETLKQCGVDPEQFKTEGEPGDRLQITLPG